MHTKFTCKSMGAALREGDVGMLNAISEMIIDHITDVAIVNYMTYKQYNLFGPADDNVFVCRDVSMTQFK